jgi:hypothetical protein
MPGLNIIGNSRSGHGMATNFDEEIREPTQFSLQGLFVATAVVGVALSVFKCFGLFTMILSVQCAAVVAVLFKSRGTAWPGVVVMGLAPALFVMLLSRLGIPFYGVLFVASLGAWFGGGIAADIESKRRSAFLRWSWLFALIWFLTLVVIGIIFYED